MDYNAEEKFQEPLSPMAQNFSSSVLRLYVIIVFEFEFDVPIDDLDIAALLPDLLLSSNPRFSSILVKDKFGEKRWKQVEVKLKEHIFVPRFPEGMPLASYDECFGHYVSKISMDPMPDHRPLWEVHVFKYPTTNAAGGALIFRFHHSIGDGYSFMSLILSCFRRADDPSLPLTFPSRKSSKSESGKKNIFLRPPGNDLRPILDHGWDLLNSTRIEDEKTPIRSADEEVEFKPTSISHIFFSINVLTEIKSKLDVTINDVIAGIIFYGSRLYMEEVEYQSRNAVCSASVVLNTRRAEYLRVKDKENTDVNGPWGNRILFMHIPIPKLDGQNPLDFIWKARDTIKMKRSPLSVFLTDKLSEITAKYRSQEVVAKQLHNTLRNSSAMISNMIGPIEQIALANHPIKGMYFIVPGVPQSLGFTIVSYMEMLRVTIKAEEGFIDMRKLKSCLNKAFESILKLVRDQKLVQSSHIVARY